MNILVTEKNWDEVCANILSKTHLAVDTETTGLRRWHEDRLFSIVISTDSNNYYFNFLDYSQNLGNPSEWTHISYEGEVYLIQGAHLKRELTPRVIRLMQGKRIFMHNAKFDLAMLQNECELPDMDIHDTMVGARLIHNDHHRYNLDSCVQRDLKLKKSDLVMKYIVDNKCFEMKQNYKGDLEKKLQFDRVPFGLMFEYACKDAAITYQLGMFQLEQIKLESEGPKNTYGFGFDDACREELGLTKHVFKIETRGIRIDREYCEKAFKYERDRYKSAEEDFYRETGEKFIDSGDRLGEILQKRGHQIPTTEKGTLEISEGVLSRLQDPLAEVVIKHRDAYKRAHTYFENFLYHADKNDLIHCDMAQSGTRTGRFSYRDPNLQNVTGAVEGEEYPIRKAFVPRDGKYFVMIDYDQMEFRMMLDYAGELPLIKKIKEGLDPHQATSDLTKLSRNQAKTLNFACIAEGSLVLTPRGLIPIQDVTTADLVWDGIEWVSHEGVIYQGIKECIEYEGLTATPDHKVFTDKGRKICFRDAVSQERNGRIFTSAVETVPIRYPFASGELSDEGQKASNDSGLLLKVFKDLGYCMRKYFARVDTRLSMLKGPKVFRGSGGDKSSYKKILVRAYTLLLKKCKSVEALWRTRYSRKVFDSGVVRFFYSEILKAGNIVFGSGPNKQRWKLRNWKFTTSDAFGKFKEPKKFKVYDIVNAGPRNRFTVSGKLVSNCLYGVGKAKLAEMLSTSPDSAYKFKQQYFNALPNVEHLIYRCTSRARTHKKIVNWAGRIYRFDDERFCYKAANALIQGGCADVVKRAMVQLSDNVLLQIHDELLFEFDIGDLEGPMRAKQIMESVYPFKHLPLTCSVEHSLKSWGDSKEGLPDFNKTGDVI